MARCTGTIPRFHFDERRYTVRDADRDVQGEGKSEESARTVAILSEQSSILQVRTVGISVLGPGEGPFELGIESFECVNVEDREADYLLEGRKKAQQAEEQLAWLVQAREKDRLN